MDDGHRLDGIGVYTRELIGAYGELSVEHEPMAFSRLRKSDAGVRGLPGPFELLSLRSALFGVDYSPFTNPFRGFDLFHSTDHYIPKSRKIPVVATIMDPITISHPEWVRAGGRAAKNWLFRRSAGWADRIITISHFVVPELVEHLGVPEKSIRVVPLGVEAEYFKTVPETIRSETLSTFHLRPGFFLFVGTLQPRKNVDRLIEAFLRLPKDMRRNHPLVVAGRNGWMSEHTVAALRELEDAGEGRWLEYVDDAAKHVLLQSAVALTFPSLYEGFGLPVLEAFASGLPVVTSNSTSLPEVAGDAALLVDPEDAVSIAEAMKQIASSPSLRDALSVAGRNRAKEFTWKKTALSTLEVYRELLQA